MSVEPFGNYAADDDLESIEDNSLPGTSTVGTVGRVFNSKHHKFAQDNPINSDYGIGTAPVTVTTTDVDATGGTTDPLNTLKIDPTFNTPRSRTPMSSKKISARNLELSISDEGFNKTAWLMENGEPYCNHCDTNFIPERIGARMACTNCGCGDPANDHGLLDGNFDGSSLDTGSGQQVVACRVANYEEGDIAPDGDVVKTGDEEVTAGRKFNSTEDYLDLFQKKATDSELYYRGYEEAKAGRPLDVDLAEVSDDYFNGYQDRSVYKSTPQNSAPQKLFDIKPNSNLLPRTQGSKTANEQMEQMILDKLNDIEQSMCGCGSPASNQFNGQPQCSPGEGCCTDAQPGACPECGKSFHGHNICGPRGCDGVWQPTDESPAEKIEDHDNWAAETNHGQFESSRRFKSNLPTDVVARFFED